MNDDIEWLDYLKAVAEEANLLGYNMRQVAMFKNDVYDAWLEGVSVQDCVAKEF